MECRSSAAKTASPTERTCAGAVMIDRRRWRIFGSLASARAKPICDWAARAAERASAGSTPSRRTRRSATACGSGIRNPKWRHRERIVVIMSSALGAHSSHTVRSGGSSTALRRTFAVRSIMRSASSMTMTRQRPCEGAVCARTTICRTSSMRIWVDSVLRIVTSPFVRARVVTHPGH